MKKILSDFADNVLKKDDLKKITGGDQKTCGQCWSYVTNRPIFCTGTYPACNCAGGGNQACA